MTDHPTPRFFRTPAAFRRWLEKNHATAGEIWVGFWKRDSGKGGMVYPQALDEALCFGWIDGLVRGRDAACYMQRFTPRRPRSIWSAVNLRKVEALKAAGRMAPSGLEALEKRDPKRANLYSNENRHVILSAAYQKRFKANKAAWKFFEAQPPGYRRLAAFRVMSARKEETRERRFSQLVAGSQRGERVGQPAQTPPRQRKGA